MWAEQLAWSQPCLPGASPAFLEPPWDGPVQERNRQKLILAQACGGHFKKFLSSFFLNIISDHFVNMKIVTL
jgi:hypothetical protein